MCVVPVAFNGIKVLFHVRKSNKTGGIVIIHLKRVPHLISIVHRTQINSWSEFNEDFSFWWFLTVNLINLSRWKHLHSYCHSEQDACLIIIQSVSVMTEKRLNSWSVSRGVNIENCSSSLSYCCKGGKKPVLYDFIIYSPLAGTTFQFELQELT